VVDLTFLLPVTLSLLTARWPTRSTLFPYTTLFRSAQCERLQPAVLDRRGVPGEHGAQRLAAPGPHAASAAPPHLPPGADRADRADRKSTRLNSSHVKISYAVFCLKKKNNRDAKL